MKSSDLQKHISSKTACVVAIAGNTPFGYIDDIADLADLCTDEHIYLHIDAAFGGFIIPFISKKIIDFRTGISSICIDAHKMGMSCIPCGFLLLKDQQWFDKIQVHSRCTHTRYQMSLLGTRPGASAASAYAVMQFLGYEGYQKNANQCIENTKYLTTLLNTNNIIYVKPELNIVAIKTSNAYEITNILAQNGWYVGFDESHEVIRIVVMPHVSKETINNFVNDLKKVIH
jgi:tyrosine decarboxylase/aspartate 1-decarboxylase